MALAAGLFLALGIAVLCLAGYAIRKIHVSGLYGPGQLWAQTALILLIPFLGAFLAIHLCRDRVPLFQQLPADDARDMDCSNVDYHG